MSGGKNILWWGSWNLQNLHCLRTPSFSDNMCKPVSVQSMKVQSRSSVARIDHRMWTSVHWFPRHLDSLHIQHFNNIIWNHSQPNWTRHMY
jgi:hypothetical protein